MPKVTVVNMQGQKVEEMDLSEAVFGIEPNEAAMHMAVVNYLANQRQGNQSTKTRAEVSGGGRKPWRQKGTGHARQGSTRSPQWTHGGIAHGPKPRDFRIALNKKVRQLAIRSALSSKTAGNELIVLDSFQLDSFSTKTTAKMLTDVGAKKKALIILPENDKVLVNSVRNIEGAKSALINTINVYDILNADSLIIVKDAVGKLEEVYA